MADGNDGIQITFAFGCRQYNGDSIILRTAMHEFRWYCSLQFVPFLSCKHIPASVFRLPDDSLDFLFIKWRIMRMVNRIEYFEHLDNMPEHTGRSHHLSLAYAKRQHSTDDPACCHQFRRAGQFVFHILRFEIPAASLKVGMLHDAA